MATNSFFVIDAEEVSVSWAENAEKGERFGSESQALKRAKQLAAAEPGKTFLVCKATHAITCPVGEPEVERFKS